MVIEMPRPISKEPTFTAKFENLEQWQRMKIVYVLLKARDNYDFMDKLLKIAESGISAGVRKSNSKGSG